MSAEYYEQSDIPHDMRPDPRDYACDLEQSLRSIVTVKTRIPADAMTASGLGHRTGGTWRCYQRQRTGADNWLCHYRS